MLCVPLKHCVGETNICVLDHLLQKLEKKTDYVSIYCYLLEIILWKNGILHAVYNNKNDNLC